MVRIPSGSVIKGGYIQCGGGFSAATVDVGVFSVSNSALLDADILLDGVDIGAAAARFELLADGTGVAAIALHNKQVWELAGFASDPGGFVDIKVTLKASLTTTSGLKLVVEYTAN